MDELQHALARYSTPARAAGCARPARRPAERWAVRVTRAGGQLTVEIADRSGVSAVRTVSGVDVAAAVVDSWVHRDARALIAAGYAREPARHGVAGRAPTSHQLSRPSAVALAEPQEPSRTAEPPPTIAPAPPAAAGATPAPPPPASPVPSAAVRLEGDRELASPPRSPLTITLGPETSVASDATTWWGASGGACLHVGRFCVGLLARGARGSAIVGDPGTTRRTTADLLAALDLPFAVRGVVFVAGAGIGAGVLQANTSDPNSPPGEVSGARQSTTFGARAMARVLIDLPITGRFGVDVGGSFDAALPARGPASDGQGGLYPAEPRSFLRGQIALRYGAP